MNVFRIHVHVFILSTVTGVHSDFRFSSFSFSTLLEKNICICMYILKGSGIFEINGVEHDVSPGTFLHMAPTEKHGIWIPEDREGPLRVLVTGVTVGEKK